LLWKPDQYPCFLSWDTKQLCVKNEDCLEEDDTCKVPREFKPGYKTRLRFRRPPELDPIFDDVPAHICYQAQLCFIVTGKARVKAILLEFRELQEDEVPV
jgi:hypothetical protein